MTSRVSRIAGGECRRMAGEGGWKLFSRGFSGKAV